MSSRTPVNGVGYDKSLLADAPAITKADKQEGYNPDLLEQGNGKPHPSPRAGAATPGSIPPGKYGGSDEGAGRRRVAAAPPPTQKGNKKKLWIIVGVIAFLLIVAVAVGVGVGVGKKKNNNDTAPVTNPPTAPSVPVGGTETTKSISDATETTKELSASQPDATQSSGDSSGGTGDTGNGNGGVSPSASVTPIQGGGGGKN